MSTPLGAWRNKSKCKELSTEEADALFFPSKGGKVNKSDSYCSDCPVRSLCLQEAIDAKYNGYWAGTTDKERTKYRIINTEIARRLDEAMPKELKTVDAKPLFELVTSEATDHHAWMDTAEPTALELLLLETAS